MRKIFMVGASAAASVLLMTGCNKQVMESEICARSATKCTAKR